VTFNCISIFFKVNNQTEDQSYSYPSAHSKQPTRPSNPKTQVLNLNTLLGTDVSP